MFEKGHEKYGGRKKGTKNKPKPKINWDEELTEEFQKALLALIKGKNPTVIIKLIDKMEANAIPDPEDTNDPDEELEFKGW